MFIFSLDRGLIDQNLLNIKVLFEEDLDMSSYFENQTTPKHYKLIGAVIGGVVAMFVLIAIVLSFIVGQ